MSWYSPPCRVSRGVINRIAREVPEAVCVSHAWGCGRGGPRDTLRDEMVDLMIRVINGESTQAERHGMDVFTFMTVHPPF